MVTLADKVSSLFHESTFKLHWVKWDSQHIVWLGRWWGSLLAVSGGDEVVKE